MSGKTAIADTAASESDIEILALTNMANEALNLNFPLLATWWLDEQICR